MAHFHLKRFLVEISSLASLVVTLTLYHAVQCDPANTSSGACSLAGADLTALPPPCPPQSPHSPAQASPPLLRR